MKKEEIIEELYQKYLGRQMKRVKKEKRELNYIEASLLKNEARILALRDYILTL